MAFFELSELISSITFFFLSLLGLVLALISLYIVVTLASLFVYYVKESVDNSGGAPVIGTMFHLLFYFDNFYDFILDAGRKHSTFRLIFDAFHSELFVSDPASVEHVLKNCFFKYSKGKYNYDVLKDLLGDGIFSVDGEKWRQQRKLASHEFATRVLKDFSSVVFRSNAVKLANKISYASRSSTTIEMQDLLMKSTLDSIFNVGFGVELNTLSGSNEEGARFSQAFDDSNHIVFHRYADTLWRMKRYLDIGMEGRLKRNLKVIDYFVFQLIRHKKEILKNGLEISKEDILSRFIVASEEDSENMTDKYLRDIILNFLIAGKDTTANSLTWFLYMLCKHPSVQEKVAMEIERVTQFEGDLDFEGFAANLSHEHLDKMHYLHAALSETLRLYPAIPVDGKIADEDDVLPSGYKVKKGDGVNFSMYAMARMTDLWGDNAEEFCPERWLDEDGTFRPESQFKFVTFNAGPRICLGKDFAYRQMKILAAVMLHFFVFKLADEAYVAKYKTMFTLHMKEGLPLLALQKFK